jgi:acyl phosphate:glycerol-3-phosphate acyltransferase
VLDTLWRFALVVVVGYLVGGVPFGVLVSRSRGLDITKLGSGNTGATNVYRNLGWRAGLTVMVLDVAKGVLPAVFAVFIANPAWGVNGRDAFVVLAGGAAMAGHVYSPYLRLRGGKGISAAAGVILVLMPKVFLALALVFFCTALAIRIVSLGSVLAALVFAPIVALLYPGHPVMLVFAVFASLLVLWRHRSNMARLVRGEEPRIIIGSRGKDASAGSGRDGS